MTAPRSVTVVGGGIAGLAAAHALAPHAEVTLVESSASLGGKIASGIWRGQPHDVGPDAFITRNAAATELCHAVGIGADLIAPSAPSAAIFARGRLRPFPSGLAIGIPTDLRALARSGIVTPGAAVRARFDRIAPWRVPPTLVDDAHSGLSDPTVDSIVGRRLGRGVVDALVDPLIGGINAGDVRSLSFVAALPQLAPLIAGRRSISRALRPRPGPRTEPPRPVFFGLAQGIGSLISALEATLERAGVGIRRGTTAEHLGRGPTGGWELATDNGTIASDAIVLATPAGVSARILAATAPLLRAELEEIAYAGVATVTLAWADGSVPECTTIALGSIRRPGTAEDSGSARVLPGSGVLIPRRTGRSVTAATFTSTKWPGRANPGEIIVRASVGRYGDQAALDLDDEVLVATVRRELEEILGITDPPLDARVDRWPLAFPQYRPGHLARIGRIREHGREMTGFALCGAAYDGIGIPACIESGYSAARAVIDTLGW